MDELAKLTNLARAILRKSKGKIAIRAPEPKPLMAALQGKGAELCDTGARTIILFETLKADNLVDGDAGIDAAWAALPHNGILIVITRNAEICPQQGFHHRKLCKRLDRLGSASALRQQPFRWVGAVLAKGIEIDRDSRLRLDAVASLCCGRVLELGSGDGHLSALIAAQGCDVVGVELNCRKVAKAGQHYPGLNFVQGDILALPDELTGFDNVVIAEVLEHVPEAVGAKMCEIAAGRLRPGGRLVVSTPYEKMVPHRNHVTEFSAAVLRDLLASYGEVRLHDHQPLRWLLASVDLAG